MKKTLVYPHVKLPDYSSRPLNSRISIKIMERKRLPLAVINFTIWGGAANDLRGKEGLYRFTARMLKQGAGKYSADKFAFELESKGANLYVQTTYDSVNIIAGVLAKDTEWGLEIIAEMIKNPRFSDIEINRLKKKTIGEIKSLIDEPSGLCASLHNNNLFKGHPYGRPVFGYENTVKSFEKDDVSELHSENMLKSRMQLTVVGDVDAEVIYTKASSLFSSLKFKARKTVKFKAKRQVKKRTLYIINKPDLSQAHIRLGNIGIARNDPDIYNLLVTNTLFGGSFTSRLNDEIRVNRGLTYGINSVVTSNLLHGSVRIVTSTKNSSAAMTIDLILREIKKLNEIKVTEKELNSTKQYMTGLFPLSLETNRTLGQHLSDISLYRIPEDYIDNFCESIISVTTDDVYRTARRYFPLDDSVITILGKADEINIDPGNFDKIIHSEFSEIYSTNHQTV